MSNLANTFKYVSNIESIINKDWAAGSRNPTSTNEFIETNQKLAYQTIVYPPALGKMFDEAIVNALDHAVKYSVSYIDISFDQHGKFSTRNDGPGVPIEIHKEASKVLNKEIYIPTLIFSQLYQGSNHVDNNSIAGGTNGIGAKICNYYSTEYTITIRNQNMLFYQKWLHGKEQQYQISQDQGPNFVEVSFIPDYVELFGGFSEVLVQFVLTRVNLAAAYLATASPLTRLSYNNIKIQTSLVGFIKRAFDTPTASIMFSIKSTMKPILVDLILAPTTGLPKSICLVNGIRATSIQLQKYVYDNLATQLKNKAGSSLITSKLLSKFIFVCINAQLPRKIIGWTGQRKDVLDNLPSTIMNAFVFPNVSDQLISYVETLIVRKKPKSKIPESTSYKPAKYAGTQASSRCQLLLVEGLSAMTQAITGISKHYGWDYYGAFSLQGVIMNVRKECVRINDFANSNQYKTKTKYQNSKFIEEFNSVLGLNTLYKYDPKSTTYSTEIAELRYGGIIACVDQDLDGKGNILGLLINMFDFFWPTLIDSGFVKWFQTPIIRTYPLKSGRVIEFYSVDEFEEWKKTNDPEIVRYYKGLASHSDDESLNMFKKLHEKTLTFRRDNKSTVLFEKYYGTVTSFRKEELSTPAMQNIKYDKQIYCTDFIQYEVKPYHLDNIHRKLIHIMDGQNQAGRKILDGVIKAFAKTKSMKASQLAGFISSELNYHHGEASLGHSVINRAFIGVGGKQIPLLLPESQTGTRFGGGKDCGDPRYVHVKLNKPIINYLFPHEDYHLLNFNFDDGERVEPSYFVPILPLALLESHKIPATGWKLEIWARDVIDVIDAVRKIIKYDIYPTNLRLATYKNTKYEWKGKIGYINGVIHTFGVYCYAQNTIIITELPLREWTNEYIANLRKKQENGECIIKSIENNSNNIDINIKIKLYPDAMDKLDKYDNSPWADSIEVYFSLYSPMHNFLNIVNSNGSVQTYNNYVDMIKPWFEERKKLYGLRVERAKILAKLTKIKTDNMIRYITESKTIVLATKKMNEMVSDLETRKYAKIDLTRLNSPLFLKNDELEQTILFGRSASFDYLLHLHDANKSEENLKKLTETRSIFVDEDIYFSGATLWLRELEQLEKNIVEGFKTNWSYGKVYTF